MTRISRTLCFTASLLLWGGTPVLGRSGPQAADSLKKVIAGHRSLMHVADSLGDDEEALAARLQLAPLVKPKEATVLLKDAVTLAGKLDPVTEMQVRTQLAQHYERIGDHRSAYAEAMTIVALGEDERSAQQEASVSAARQQRAIAAVERDSLQQVWSEALSEAMAVGSEAEVRSQRWMWIAVGSGVLFLFTLGVVVRRSGRSDRKIRAELHDLRSEIVALKEHRTTEQVRVVPPPDLPLPGPITAPVVPLAPEPSPAADIDPIVMAMFRKMAPERLSALRDARARGDKAKVLRVVHSLKPQLVNFDHERFTVLCARIVSPEAATEQARQDADLDALEQGIADVLDRIGH